MRRLNLIGNRYGKLVVLSDAGSKCSICGRIKRKKYLWFGKEKEYIGKLPMIAIMHEDKGEM